MEIKKVWETVSEERFCEFVKDYPRDLERDCTGICEPPVVAFYDLALPEQHNIVAKFDVGEPGEYYGLDYKRTYQVLTNHEEIFANNNNQV